MYNQETKDKLAQSLKQLMKQSTLEKITVKEIADGCNLTRQTFYRNFEDKYALVNWYFEQLVMDSFEAMNGEKTLFQALENKFNFIMQELTFFRVAFKTQSYQSLIEYDYRYIVQFYTRLIQKKTGRELPRDIAFALELYCRGSIAQTVSWVNADEKESPKEMAKMLVVSLPPKLAPLLLDFD